MNGYLIAAICVIVAGALVYFGIKTRKFSLILGAVGSLLLALFSGQRQTIKDQRAELKAKEEDIRAKQKRIDDDRRKIEEATVVAEKVKEIQSDETKKPERKESPAHGDSDGRLDRLGRL